MRKCRERGNQRMTDRLKAENNFLIYNTATLLKPTTAAMLVYSVLIPFLLPANFTLKRRENVNV